MHHPRAWVFGALASILVIVCVITVTSGTGGGQSKHSRQPGVSAAGNRAQPAGRAQNRVPVRRPAYCLNSTTGARTKCSPRQSPSPPRRAGFAPISPHPGSRTRLIAQLQLASPSGARRPVAVGRIVEQGGGYGITILGADLPANTKRNAYSVWLTDGTQEAKLLGTVSPAVTNNGKLSTAEILPRQLFRYRELLITLETRARPATPGRVVLKAALHSPRR
jgi:hypothetical protein